MIYIYIYIYIYENEVRNLTVFPTFWILPKL